VKDTFKTRRSWASSGRTLEIASLRPLGKRVERLPFSMRILLENLLRHEDGVSVRSRDIEALLDWDPRAEPEVEIAFTPARVLLQDFTGVPAVVDLAAMRDAMARLGGEPRRINPRQPVELVIDHSVQVDAWASSEAKHTNARLEFQRNRERYLFLRWGQQAFENFRVVPPDTGIVHQVNLEYLARVVMVEDGRAFPDTLVGTDSHTTMINALGVLGWGVGGIEAEAAMLGQPVSMLLPQVIGFRLHGELPEGSTATDLVLRVTEILRQRDVVGKFVEFHGPGLDHLPLADRATIANMAPEYGATCGIFPIDATTLDYLRFTGRAEEQVALVEAYAKEQGLFRESGWAEAEYTEVVELDLASVEPSLAGPSRPQDRVELSAVKSSFRSALSGMLTGAAGSRPRATTVGRMVSEGGPTSAVLVEPEDPPEEGVRARIGGETVTLRHGSLVIAAITSCTNTSNPSVMLAAGLLAKKAVERGLRARPWVKTSLAPGSKVVSEYLARAGLDRPLEALGFHTVGYGCTTCIGNSGPLAEPVAKAIEEGHLVVASVLSGNRNFEGRIHPLVRANYLASPPLVVAFALAGRIDVDLRKEPLGEGRDGKPVFLREVWPSQAEVRESIEASVRSEMFRSSYAHVFEGGAEWRELDVPAGDTYAWDPASTYVQEPPYFQDMRPEPPAFEEIRGARVLALVGDSVTTDHISPAGSIKPQSPAGRWLQEQGVSPADFNSYGSRRGNHEVMMRGTFANVRFKNRLVPGVEGSETVHLPDGERMSIYDAAMRYAGEGVPLLVIAGKEYGTGSSRDWAAKGPRLLGVRAVIAESFERIHRSNLVGMGIVPLQFRPGEGAGPLGLSGRETYEIEGLEAGLRDGFKGNREVRVRAKGPEGDGGEKRFEARVRIDTPQELEYVRHGGILHYVLRKLLANGS
jgi:aconitate hydratase